MNIKTKFGVKENNLAILKYRIPPKNSHHVFVILELKTVSCYNGTQIFYFGRFYLMQKDYVKKYPKEEGEFKWVIGPAVMTDKNSGDWQRFREDELKEIPKEVAKIFKASKP